MIIQAINRNQMRYYKPDTQNSVAICIYSTGDNAPKLQPGWKYNISLQFDDVDPNSHPAKLVLFNTSHANHILNFIACNPDNIIINCDAGISRSVGVMVALEYIYNNNNVFNKYPLHNKHVANTIIKVWEKNYGI